MSDTTKEINEYETLLDTTPEEVRNFLWSDAYTVVIQSISKPYKLNENQTNVFKQVIFDIIIGYINEPTAKNRLTEAGIPQNNQEKLFILAYDYIINPMLENAEEEIILNKEEELPNKPQVEIKIPENIKEVGDNTQEIVLQNITNRLQKTTVIAPSKRTHTIEKMGDTNKSTQTDPYREIPE